MAKNQLGWSLWRGKKWIPNKYNQLHINMKTEMKELK